MSRKPITDVQGDHDPMDALTPYGERERHRRNAPTLDDLREEGETYVNRVLTVLEETQDLVKVQAKELVALRRQVIEQGLGGVKTEIVKPSGRDVERLLICLVRCAGGSARISKQMLLEADDWGLTTVQGNVEMGFTGDISYIAERRYKAAKADKESK